MRHGTTLLEITSVLAILGIMASMAFPRFAGYRDRVAVGAGTTSAVAMLATARYAAVRRATITAISFDTIAATITVFAGADTIERRSLGAVHGVRLTASRDSIAYAPNGMGYGAANTKLVVSRGAAAETLTVSRLGRVRR
jgi:prepilin-type N-terminal cleavage/methylation domain-containing protein